MAMRTLTYCLILFIAANWLGAQAPVRDRHVEARLVAEHTGIVPGQTLRVGLLLRHDPRWHTYWKTTATGYASSLDWDLPEGFAAGEIEWTVPQVYDFSGYIEYVYEGDTLLPVTLTVPPDLSPGDTITLRATAAWLMCEKTCIPGEVELSLTLPVVDEQPPPDSRWAEFFAEAARNQPVQSADYTLTAWRATGDTAVLQIEGDAAALEGELYFFDEATFILPEAKQPQARVSPGVVQLQFPIDEAGVGDVDRFQGVLHTTSSWLADDTRPALVVDVPFRDSPPSGVATPADASEPVQINFALTLALAFAGGFILNLMPCVFPIIGVKILGFVNQSGADRKKIVTHGLVFTAGVLLSFWILAGGLILLRAGGDLRGWGYQLQNPVFIYGLSIFLLLFALSLSGVFEIGNSAIGIGSRLSARDGMLGTFLSGVLATVMATPCAAPILGPALGVALALPAFSSLVVFTAIALGLSLPYLVLSAFPRLVQMLPRPGAWMESFKQFMAFLLYATVGYLLWVLVGQLTETSGFTPAALLWSIFGLVIAAMAAWLYGRWAAPHRPQGTRRIAIAAALLVFSAGFALGYPRPAYDPDELAASDSPAVQWENWSAGLPEQLAQEGKIVYVDFTARWCVTCQSNKAVVFSSHEVRSFFHENEVIALKADWTNQDATIAAELQRFGRSAVPFNLIYSPNTSQPHALPELLTPGIVLDALHAAQAHEF